MQWFIPQKRWELCHFTICDSQTENPENPHPLNNGKILIIIIGTNDINWICVLSRLWACSVHISVAWVFKVCLDQMAKREWTDGEARGDDVSEKVVNTSAAYWANSMCQHGCVCTCRCVCVCDERICMPSASEISLAVKMNGAGFKWNVNAQTKGQRRIKSSPEREM